jgi:hypothetical protein
MNLLIRLFKPFFLYYVPGGTHAPHQPTQGQQMLKASFSAFDPERTSDAHGTIVAHTLWMPRCRAVAGARISKLDYIIVGGASH